MLDGERKIMLIDMKSFYASCEAVALGLNPLKAVLVVASHAENTGSGLVLASSPRAKQLFGISNVTRVKELPDDERLLQVPPRMNYYIAMNEKVNDIFREFVSEDMLHVYSIDESILDLTSSWRYLQDKYGLDLTMRKLARIIQHEVKERLGLYITVGIGKNPVQAKLALDIGAKHDFDLMAEYNDEFRRVLWQKRELEDIWSIGRKTAKRLQNIGIFTLGDLARTEPYRLKEEFGIRGFDLYALAWGVDESRLDEPYHVEESSISNGQVLPHDYTRPTEIMNVIREMGEQLASRLRHAQQQTRVLSLGLGYSQGGGFSRQVKISPTNLSSDVVTSLKWLFDEYYDGSMVRNVYVSAGKLVSDHQQQLDLFAPDSQQKDEKLDKAIDRIREKYGTAAVVKASSLGEGGTMIKRVGLVGGHAGGNTYV